MFVKYLSIMNSVHLLIIFLFDSIVTEIIWLDYLIYHVNQHVMHVASLVRFGCWFFSSILKGIMQASKASWAI